MHCRRASLAASRGKHEHQHQSQSQCKQLTPDLLRETLPQSSLPLVDAVHLLLSDKAIDAVEDTEVDATNSALGAGSGGGRDDAARKAGDEASHWSGHGVRRDGCGLQASSFELAAVAERQEKSGRSETCGVTPWESRPEVATVGKCILQLHPLQH